MNCCLKIGSFYPRVMHILREHVAKGEEGFCVVRKDVDVSQAFGCDLCDFTSHDKNKVGQHQRAEHPIERRRNHERIVCLLCDEKFTGANNSIQKHLITDHQFASCAIHCPFEGCTEVFASKAGLVGHLKNKTGHNCNPLKAQSKGEEAYLKVYPKTFNGEKTKVKRKIKDWSCVCEAFNDEMDRRDRENGYTVNRKQAFLRHHRHCEEFQTYLVEHEEECKKRYGKALDGYFCGKCPDLPPFSEPCALANHIRKVHVSRDVPCPVCGKLIRDYNLQGHIDDQHNPDMTYPCEFDGCDEEPFPTKAALRYHVERKHQEKLSCDTWYDPETKEEIDKEHPSAVLCTHKCFGRGSMWVHRRRIHGPKKHKCEFSFCSAAFGTAKALRVHIRESHTPKYQCFFCDEKTITLPELRDHLLTHQGKKRKKCSCSELFYEGDHLNHHQACCAKGEEAMLQCKICKWHRVICKRGPRISEGEVAIARVLTHLGVPFRKEASISKRVIHDDPSQNGTYHFDFRATFDDLEVFIEYDGRYHFRPYAERMQFFGQVYRDLSKSRFVFKSKKTKIIRVTGDNGDVDMLRCMVNLNLTWTRDDGSKGSATDIQKFLQRHSPKRFDWRRWSYFTLDANTILDRSGFLKKAFKTRDLSMKVTIPCVVQVAQTLNHCPEILMHDLDTLEEPIYSEVTKTQKEVFGMKEAIALLFLRENRELTSDLLESNELRIVACICAQMPEFRHLLPKLPCSSVSCPKSEKQKKSKKRTGSKTEEKKKRTKIE